MRTKKKKKIKNGVYYHLSGKVIQFCFVEMAKENVLQLSHVVNYVVFVCVWFIPKPVYIRNSLTLFLFSIINYMIILQLVKVDDGIWFYLVSSFCFLFLQMFCYAKCDLFDFHLIIKLCLSIFFYFVSFFFFLFACLCNFILYCCFCVKHS